jgi:DnaK suppressor protein
MKKTQTVKKRKLKSVSASAVKKTASPKSVKKTAAAKTAKRTTTAKTTKKTITAGKTGGGAVRKAASNPAATEGKVRSNKKQKNLSQREQMIQKIKMKLLRQKEALLNEAESALNELPGQTIFPDLGDQATAETDRNFMLRLRGREQRLLKKIEEAIERIDGGSFGICDDCGNEIDIKRLDARPVTTMCIECKTLQEEEEKLREA